MKSWLSVAVSLFCCGLLAGCAHPLQASADNATGNVAENSKTANQSNSTVSNTASTSPASLTGSGIAPSLTHQPLDKVLAPGSKSTPQWLPTDIPKHLVDPFWIADPKNYEVTTKTVVNSHLSVPILEYHEVNYFPGDVATLKPGQFRQEITWLHQHHFHTINFGQLYAAMYHGYKLPSRPIVVSFDDGYESNYLKAFPLLEKYHYQATIFMISGDVLQKPDRKVRFPKLTASELQEMQQSGLVDIESHTVHHTELSTVSLQKAWQELTQSSASLQRVVGHPIRFFCYPFGGYTKQDLTEVKKAGYLLATTEHQGYATANEGPLTLDRIAVLDYTTMTQFESKLAPSLQGKS